MQLSLVEGLDAAEHVAIGRALSSLRKRGVWILGSGMSFHNMQTLMMPRPDHADLVSAKEFDEWLKETCCDEALSHSEAEDRLTHWLETAPNARSCHPREEHLLPLHVCFGAASAAGGRGSVAFAESVMGVPISGFLWETLGSP